MNAIKNMVTKYSLVVKWVNKRFLTSNISEPQTAKSPAPQELVESCLSIYVGPKLLNVLLRTLSLQFQLGLIQYTCCPVISKHVLNALRHFECGDAPSVC